MRKLARRLGYCLLGLAVLFFGGRFTILPAILPVDLTVIGVALLGLVLVVLGRRNQPEPVSILAKAAIGVSLISVLWSLAALLLEPAHRTIVFSSGGTRLVGDVYLPRGRCPCPAVVFVHGSGESPASDYAYYARRLASRGIVAFAFDKRGSGRSAGNIHDGGYTLYARNVADAVSIVKAMPDVDPDRVSLVGYSEGEWVAPLAAQLTKVASIAVIGGSGLSPVGQGDEQAAIRMAASRYSANEIGDMLLLSAATRAYERSGRGREALLREIAPLHQQPWFDLAGNLPHPEELATFEQYGWWRSYMETDPADLWSKVRIPVLFLKGGKDDHSDGAKSIARLKRYRSDATIKLYPDADHILVRHPFGGHLPPAVFADYFDLLADFVNKAPATPAS